MDWQREQDGGRCWGGLGRAGGSLTTGGPPVPFPWCPLRSTVGDIRLKAGVAPSGHAGTMLKLLGLHVAHRII